MAGQRLVYNLAEVIFYFLFQLFSAFPESINVHQCLRKLRMIF